VFAVLAILTGLAVFFPKTGSNRDDFLFLGLRLPAFDDGKRYEQDNDGYLREGVDGQFHGAVFMYGPLSFSVADPSTIYNKNSGSHNS
jgi:hypothetical protein